MLSRFHLVPEGNGQPDGRTDRFAISVSRVSMLTRDKNRSNVRPCMGVSVRPCGVMAPRRLGRHR